MTFIKSLIKSLIKELRELLRSRDVIILLALGPIALTILLGGAYVNTYIEDIPIAILDEDNSSMSRMIAEQFDENQRFFVKGYVENTEQLNELIDSKKIYMGVCIPEDLSKNVINGTSSQVLIIVDGTNMVIGNNSYAAATSIIQTIAAGAEIKRLEAKGVIGYNAKNMANPFVFTDRMLYNPNLAYMDYLLLGYIALFLQQVMLSGIGIRMILEGEKIAGDSIIRITLLKILSCAFYAILSVTLAIFIAKIFFHVKIRGSIMLALMFCLLYSFAISGPAIFIAAVVKDKLKYIQLAYMLSLPTFISCGYIWPLSQMPNILVWIIKCAWPLIFFAKPFDELLFKGIFPSQAFIGLLIFTAIWLPISLIFFKYRFKSEGKLIS